MKKASTRKADGDIPELRREELGQGVRGKYFRQYSQESNVVILQPEIHQAFPTSEAVNQALGSLLAVTRETAILTARARKARKSGK